MDLKIVISVVALRFFIVRFNFHLRLRVILPQYENCIFHVLIRVLFFQVYYTFVLVYVSLKHAYCDNFIYCSMRLIFALNYALHTILLQYYTPLLQLRWSSSTYRVTSA
jgi:hypothetical protein